MTAESPIRTHVRRLIGLNLRLGNEAELILLAAEHFGRKLPLVFSASSRLTTSCRHATRHVISSKRIWNHRSEEQTPELQSLMRISYAVFCFKQQQTLLT